jgi:hypothetical protein
MEATEIEELFLQFLVTLPTDVQKQIVNHDVHLLETIDEESEYELKEEFWRRACYAINMQNLIGALRDLQEPDEESESESETEQTSASDSE